MGDLRPVNAHHRCPRTCDVPPCTPTPATLCFPLGSAFAGIPKVTEHPAVIAAAHIHGATPAQIGPAWLLAHSANVLLIPGTSRLTHLAENVAAGDVHLDADTMARLDGPNQQLPDILEVPGAVLKG